MMMMMRRRRRKDNPTEEAKHFCLNNKDKNGFEIRFIDYLKGRGVFSCTDFEKGDFLLEYRGDLISKEECERRQRIYHNALKVFMFEFRFNGKFFCVDAARDDGSLGRLVNDDHISPNCRMKTIRVDGKPHLCLFAIRSICTGEEITYNYGNSEWPWRCKMTGVKQQLNPQEIATKKVSGKTASEDQQNLKESNTLFQSEVRDQMDESVAMDLSVREPAKELKKVSLEKSQFALQNHDTHEKKGGEKLLTVKEHLLNEEQSFGIPTEGLNQVTLEKSQLALENHDIHEKKGGERCSQLLSVKEHLLNEEQSFRKPTEGLKQVTLEKSQLVLENHDRHEKKGGEKISADIEHLLNEEQGFCAPMESLKQVCRHVVTSTTISIWEKCAACVGPVVPFKWLGLRCKLCSSFWHKSCYVKLYGKQSTMDISSEEELSDEEYIPQSESDSQSDSSEELTTRTERQDQTNLPSQILKVVPSRSSSDVPVLDICQSKGKQILKAREAKFDLLCHEENIELDSDSGSDLRRVTDVVMSSLSSDNDEACHVKTAGRNKSQEKGPLTNIHETVHCLQSTQISCSANSKNYCYICGKPQSKLARHLKTHMSEVEVGQALSLPVNSKERKAMLQKLRNKGNYQHNTDVLQNGEGALKLKRSPKKEKDAKDYVHCMYCKGMFVRRDLWRHLRKCPSKPRDADEEQGRTRVLGLATIAESAFSQQISQGVWKLLGVMKHDDVSVVVKNDWSILQLAQSFFNKHGHDPTKFEYIRQKLREIGRLLLTLRREFSIYSLEEAVKPSNFYRLIQAVQSVSGYDEESHCYQSPSLALKLGHSLNKICEIIHCRALMSEDNELISSTDTFKKLYSSKWSELISHSALVTLNEAKFNKPSTLPFTKDVQCLHQFLEKSTNSAFEKLKEMASPQSYADLAKATLVRVIVFNRRRAGEVSKMLLKSFQERDSTSLHEDVSLGLSRFEQKLCSHFSRVEIRGKRGRKVAVLLSPDMVEALTLLVIRRSECGVHDTNSFLFARPHCQSHYRGQDSIRVYASECGAQNPEFLRSTQLRKHVATLSQILNLKNNELDQIADFLGHDIRVHRDYYRLPEATTQLAKISKLLLAMEKGSLPDLQGKSLDDIEIEDEISVNDSEASGPDESDADDDVSAAAASSHVVSAASYNHAAGVQMPIGIAAEVCSESETEIGNPRKCQKVCWSTAEVTAVMKHFKPHITKGKLATLSECQQCKTAEDPVLAKRTAQNIRDFVRNRGISLKKKAKNQ